MFLYHILQLHPPRDDVRNNSDPRGDDAPLRDNDILHHDGDVLHHDNDTHDLPHDNDIHDASDDVRVHGVPFQILLSNQQTLQLLQIHKHLYLIS